MSRHFVARVSLYVHDTALIRCLGELYGHVCKRLRVDFLFAGFDDAVVIEGWFKSWDTKKDQVIDFEEVSND